MTVLNLDCRVVMGAMEDNSIDAIVTDPPYELGFMGKKWDSTGIAFNVDMWRECLRVLKPGGHVLAFSGSRTYHRMAVAIEDAGFEIRDQIMWVYGSGFPKSLDVSKAIDKAAGVEREITGLRAKTQSYGAGANAVFGGGPSKGGIQMITAPATDAARQWNGWGTALKPAHEPICVARKPLAGTVSANVLAYGTGGINIDGCRVATTDTWSRKAGYTPANEGYGNGAFVNKTEGAMRPEGRWPANFIHDGLPEEWSRFFYCAKAIRKDRGDGNTHPTVKPTDLMRWLCRLVTPPGGLIFDPFAGSGSTGKAAHLEGVRFIGAELDADHCEIANARIGAQAAAASIESIVTI